MSLFRFAKYSTILFFLGKYKTRLFRVVGVLLFAGVTSLIYQDVAEFLHREHPGAVIYALAGKIIIVYGALAFVLWQFKPQPEASVVVTKTDETSRQAIERETPNDRLSALENISEHDRLQTRYDRLLRDGKKATD